LVALGTAEFVKEGKGGTTPPPAQRGRLGAAMAATLDGFTGDAFADASGGGRLMDEAMPLAARGVDVADAHAPAESRRDTVAFRLTTYRFGRTSYNERDWEEGGEGQGWLNGIN